MNEDSKHKETNDGKDYIGKICPYCKTALKPGDDIVVCSECGMPHHKECWIENQGCTTFGCLGTIKAADGADAFVTAAAGNAVPPMDGNGMNQNAMPLQSSGAAIYCTRCGAQNAATALFCSKCGNRLSTAMPEPQTPVYQQVNPVQPNVQQATLQQGASQSGTYQQGLSQQGNFQQGNVYAYGNQQSAAYPQPNAFASYSQGGVAIDADVQRLIGVKAEYYIPKFQEMKGQNKKNTWNWPAFLIAPYWMIYRKMYAYGAGVLGISFVLSLFGGLFGSVLAICLYIALGLFGNYIYMDFLEKRAVQLKSMNEPYKTQFAAQNGGVNMTAAVLSAVGYGLFNMVFIMMLA